ncbi:shikimate dehydrogenase [Paenalkalicoccus suaedae]|uniref:Shikimate dehydrogenase (NADP(+)) n=1 Tax=Paenalkalicoccus suaedae TaxID=2592382 RepID=A0A859FDD7_9BACI|nr:shikimate dehydrogenase [Paenalkalicoccus suaedae]QKS70831.1 shikimate dehydrogenase [Paenalkalicoccus suaedae]
MKQVFGVLGHPIEHSLSPIMHEAIYKEMQLDATYIPFLVEPAYLSDAIAGIRGLGLSGVNVTLPHKINVIPFLDELDEKAAVIGAVNTIVHDKTANKLIGFNTDGDGYVESLLPMLTKPLTESRVLIIGSGGAARGVAVTLAMRGVSHMMIVNRTPQKAQELAQVCSKWSDSVGSGLEKAQSKLTAFDVIINTTSLGMKPYESEMPMSLEALSQTTVVSDLIYTPSKTRFLLEAEKRGATIHNGLGMFINQGALAFYKWTGKQAPRDVMELAVKRKLNEMGK